MPDFEWEGEHGPELEYYPGSNTPVNDYSNPDVAEAVELPDGHLDLGPPAEVKDGVEYFYIGALANALGERKSGTIRRMITDGHLPESRWTKEAAQGYGPRREFTRQQIEDTVQIAREEGILHRTGNGRWKPISKTDFAERVREIW